MHYIVSIIILLLGLTSSCSKPSTPTSSKPVIIVSVSPYDTFVTHIAGDTLDVKVAVPANYNSHVFEPTPKQMQGFQKAAIWFGIGEPFEHSLLHSLTSYNKNLVQVDLGQNLPLKGNTDSSLALGSCTSHHHHDHESRDLHFWMSPRLASIQATQIAHALIDLFPQHRSLYEQNLLKLQKRFESLDQYLHTVLTPAYNHAIVISHPSLGYFCQDFHLIQISIECEGKTPVPKDLSKILSLSKKHPVICVFTQEQFDNKGAITIANKLNLPLHTINPNSPDYFNNLETIAKEITQDLSK